MRKTVLLYGLVGGVLIVVLKLVESRCSGLRTARSAA
jgi:hypothetical protein